MNWIEHLKEKGWTSIKLDLWDNRFINEFKKLIDEDLIAFDLKYPNNGPEDDGSVLMDTRDIWSIS